MHNRSPTIFLSNRPGPPIPKHPGTDGRTGELDIVPTAPLAIVVGITLARVRRVPVPVAADPGS